MSNYTDPKTVLSPKNSIEDLDVLYDGGERSFSVAKMIWEGSERYGIRWNGRELENGKVSKGSPISTGHPVWFILPDKIMDCIDLNKIVSEDKLISLISKKIITDISDQKLKDKEAFSIKVFFEKIKLSDSLISELEDTLIRNDIKLISHKFDTECERVIFNLAYS